MAAKPQLLCRTGPGFKTGMNKNGVFSFSTLGGPGGDGDGGHGFGSKSHSSLPRGPYKGNTMKNKGRGKGGLFSTHSYIPEGDGDARRKTKSAPRSGRWRTTGTKGGLFSSHSYMPEGDAPKRKEYNMSDYRPKTTPGRGVFRDTNRNLKGTIGSFPVHQPDPYGAKGDISLNRRGFVTYKNITRVARQGKSLS